MGQEVASQRLLQWCTLMFYYARTSVKRTKCWRLCVCVCVCHNHIINTIWCPTVLHHSSSSVTLILQTEWIHFSSQTSTTMADQLLAPFYSSFLLHTLSLLISSYPRHLPFHSCLHSSPVFLMPSLQFLSSSFFQNSHALLPHLSYWSCHSYFSWHTTNIMSTKMAIFSIMHHSTITHYTIYCLTLNYCSLVHCTKFRQSSRRLYSALFHW